MKKNNSTSQYKTIFSVMLFLYPIMIFAVMPAHASKRGNDGVSASYTNKNNGLVVLQLRIANPGPESVIVEQLLPDGSSVITVSPKPKKIGRKSGRVKWLFKNVSPGTRNITMQISPKRNSSSVKAIIRFRKPGKGMVEKRAH